MTRTKSKKNKLTRHEKAEVQYYTGEGDLADWQRLCRDLGLNGELPSKTQCRKALFAVHVNVAQFLEAKDRPEDVILFPSHRKLLEYTRNNYRYFPKDEIPVYSPLRALLETFIS